MSSSRILLILTIASLSLLLISGLAAVRDQIALARGGKALHQVLAQQSSASGSLPIWMLGRSVKSAGPETQAAIELAVDQLAGAETPNRLAGVALASAGRYPEAKSVLEKTLLSAPGDTTARVALGNLLDDQGNRTAAIATWRDQGVLDAMTYHLYRRGAVLAGRGNHEEAEKLLQLATVIDPSFADAYNALGGLYWEGDRDRAVAMYRVSLNLGGLEPFLESWTQGRIASHEERWEDAVIALREAARLRPDRGDVKQQLGIALVKVGRPEQAIPTLKEAATLSSHTPWALIELGQIHIDRQEYGAAIQVLQEAAQRQDSLPVVYALLGRAYSGLGQFEAAALAWQSAAELNRENVFFLLRAGEAWQQANQPEQALAAYQRALTLAPENQQAQQALDALKVQPRENP
jgi:superkiller protein 3